MGAVIASLDGEISQFGCGAGSGGSGDSVLARASVLVAEGEVVTGTMLGELSWAASSMSAHDTDPKERRAAAKTMCGRRLSCAFRVRALIHDRISYETSSGQYYMGSFDFLNKSVSKVRQKLFGIKFLGSLSWERAKEDFHATHWPRHAV